MAQPNRAALLVRLHKVLKKHYPQLEPSTARPVLETALFACCLENAKQDQAEEAFRSLSAMFFDWNEVRVSMVKELAEVMSMLPDPMDAAQRLKRFLQSAFETTYSFDLDSLKKGGLGPSVKRLEKSDGATPFVVAYTVQHSLGGHAIPVDQATLEVLGILGIISEQEKAKGQSPGLERAIPKSKGVEFAALLHHFAAELAANPYGTSLHQILLEVTSECRSRLPRKLTKRERDAIAKREQEAAAKKAAEEEAARQAKAAKEAKLAAEAKKKAAAEAAAKKPMPPTTKPAASKTPPGAKSPPAKAPPSGSTRPSAKPEPKRKQEIRGKEVSKPKAPAPKGKTPPSRPKLPVASAKSVGRALAKRKPR